MQASKYVIGLTGNIATGKSTVAAMLESLGATVTAADKLAHWVMRAGTPVSRRIVERFGPDVIGVDGEIDRSRLGRVVFSDPAALQDLEQIVHPGVVEETLARLKASGTRVSVVEAIKLLEANMHKHCHAVWVVTSPREQQIERIVRTRQLTSAQAELRIDAQPPAEQKLARADVTIDNSGSLDKTWIQVVRAWNAIPGVAQAPVNRPWKTPTARSGTMYKMISFLRQHPRLANGILLSIGMLTLLLWAARGQRLSATELGGLIVACLALAGACTWIISWE